MPSPVRFQGKEAFTERRTTMIDLAYVVGTIAFFALMIGYVRVCAALGKSHQTDEREP